MDVKLNASIGQQFWFQLCKFMAVYSGSHKSIQLNPWQIYFLSFKVCSYENISPVRHVYEFGIFLRWDSTLHFKFAQIVFTTIFCICLLCATTHLNDLKVCQILPHLPLLSVHRLLIQTQKCLHSVLLQDLGIIYRGLRSLNSLIFGRDGPL